MEIIFMKMRSAAPGFSFPHKTHEVKQLTCCGPGDSSNTARTGSVTVTVTFGWQSGLPPPPRLAPPRRPRRREKGERRPLERCRPTDRMAAPSRCPQVPIQTYGGILPSSITSEAIGDVLDGRSKCFVPRK